MTPTRVIVCAANRYRDTIVTGPRHFDSTMHNTINVMDTAFKPTDYSLWEEGFVDQWGVFLTREDALVVAAAAGQIDVRRPKSAPLDQLFSEDLY